MRQSELLSKTQKAAPKDEESINAKLLIRAGFVHKEMAGVYTYLPLGFRVLKNIERIVREEMNAIGGQELLMTTLQDPSVWKKSNRWSDEVVDNWFKTKLADGKEIGIANTHEEPLVALLAHHVSSYRDLPLFIYQFQTKFRNELRAKSGIMRTREFIMKDLYSFSRSEEEFKEFYETCAMAYERIFSRVGIGDKTYRTAASGGSFTPGLTDEFQTISSAGEDTIFVDKTKRLAVNKEVYTNEVVSALGLKKQDLVEEKAIEVGNIFPLGTKYSKALGFTYKNEKGEERPVVMGSYGIGLGRLMGTIVEVLSDRFDSSSRLVAILRSSDNRKRLIELIAYLGDSLGVARREGQEVLMPMDTLQYYLDMEAAKITSIVDDLLANGLLVKKSDVRYLIPDRKKLLFFAHQPRRTRATG